MSGPDRFGELLREAAARRGAGIALQFRSRALAYGELDRLADRLAAGLAARGLRRGDRIAIASLNRPEYAVALFAAARLGACLVNLLARAGAGEAAHMLDLTKPRLLLLDEAAAATFAPLAAARDIPAHRIDTDAFASLLGPEGIEWRDQAEPDDPLAITFTGGTTGRPKGCEVSHRNRLISVLSSVAGHGLDEGDVLSVTTPLAHAIALMVWYPSAVRMAAKAVLLERWSVADLRASVTRDGVTAALLVPTQLAQILDQDDAALASWQRLTKIVLGGAPSREEIIAEARRRMPWVGIIDDFGQSETGPLSYRRVGMAGDSPGSVGQPAAEVKLAIVDPTGRPLPQGEIGEIVSVGPHLMLGYHGDPEETRAYFKSGDRLGWTGDLGRIDEKGNLLLVGRSKEMIVSGGENVYAREVELVLNQHPAVADSAVFGRPDPRWGERVVAAIELRPGQSATGEAIAAFCLGRLADYKRPREVILLDALPRNPAGKILKRELQRMAERAGT